MRDRIGSSNRAVALNDNVPKLRIRDFPETVLVAFL